MFERLLALARLLVLIPVIFLVLDAAASFVYGADILVRTLTEVIALLGPKEFAQRVVRLRRLPKS